MSDSFTIASQTSLLTQSQSLGGVLYTVHHVVKGAPFYLTLSYSRAFLKEHQLTLSVVYHKKDFPPVTTLSVSPLEWKTADLDEATRTIRLQCKLNVLSSQHEGLFFRVRITACDPSLPDPSDAEALSVLSEPIKVLSKPDSLKKKRTKRVCASPVMQPSSRRARAAVAEEEDRPVKRTRGEEQMEALLLRLEGCVEQMEKMRRKTECDCEEGENLGRKSEWGEEEGDEEEEEEEMKDEVGEKPGKKNDEEMNMEEGEDEKAVEVAREAMAKMLSAFMVLGDRERAAVVSAFRNSANLAQKEAAHEFADLMLMQGLQVQRPLLVEDGFSAEGDTVGEDFFSFFY